MEPELAWEAMGFADLVPPDTLAEARAQRDALARLLVREREAAADFLLALADFDRRRGWERLGHASLFAFLTRELGLSNSAAWHRPEAGSSSDPIPRSVPLLGPGAAPAPTPVTPLLAPEVAPTRPARGGRDEVEPLTTELRRLSTTVSARFLQKLATARDGLSHSMPRATTEQVLEVALDLLLERQARRKALVKRPRSVKVADPRAARFATTAGISSANAAPGAPSDLRRIPAAVEREVRLRDGDRCQHPLDSGGLCGSTRLVELDHLVPLARGGASRGGAGRCRRGGGAEVGQCPTPGAMTPDRRPLHRDATTARSAMRPARRVSGRPGGWDPARRRRRAAQLPAERSRAPTRPLPKLDALRISPALPARHLPADSHGPPPTTGR
jgi:hypothetical protein